MCMYNQSLACLATIDRALAGPVATPHNQSLASLVASPQLAAQSVEQKMECAPGAAVAPKMSAETRPL